ncbi:MAG: hypothetical protein K0Q89_500 [Thermomicrobiales bacterium]|nr:hypothetical protein [Thermomicrobiales bacterium]
MPRGDGSGAGGSEPLLADRPDDGNCRIEVRGSRRGRGDEGAQRSLGVDRAAAPQLAVLDADGDVPRNRVDMSEEHDLARSRADGSDGVSRGVDLGTKAARFHLTAELHDGGTLLVRQTRDLDQLPQQLDGAVIRQRRAGCDCSHDLRR